MSCAIERVWIEKSGENGAPARNRTGICHLGNGRSDPFELRERRSDLKIAAFIPIDKPMVNGSFAMSREGFSKYPALRHHMIFAAETSTFLMSGGSASKSFHFAINAAAIGPER